VEPGQAALDCPASRKGDETQGAIVGGHLHGQSLFSVCHHDIKSGRLSPLATVSAARNLVCKAFSMTGLMSPAPAAWVDPPHALLIPPWDL
jgi:hypothetical protein